MKPRRLGSSSTTKILIDPSSLGPRFLAPRPSWVNMGLGRHELRSSPRQVFQRFFQRGLRPMPELQRVRVRSLPPGRREVRPLARRRARAPDSEGARPAPGARRARRRRGLQGRPHGPGLAGRGRRGGEPRASRWRRSARPSIPRPNGGSYVQTVPKRGYRFDAAMRSAAPARSSASRCCRSPAWGRRPRSTWASAWPTPSSAG